MSKIVEKIRRLLELSRSDNEYEAALAASKAQELILQFNVSEEELAKAQGDYKAEPIDRLLFYSPARVRGQVPAWYGALASVLAPSFMCKPYVDKGHGLYVIGRTSNREGFAATFQYLLVEIERLADKAWHKFKAEVSADPENFVGVINGRSWKRGFYFGVVTTVKERLAQQEKLLTQGTDAATQQTSMVLVDRRAEIVKWTRDNVGKLVSRKTKVGGDATGYNHGKSAGWDVNLAGRANKALGA